MSTTTTRTTTTQTTQEPPQIFCSHCNKPSTPENPLKACSKCQSVHYCNRECQKAHFKVHKKECASLAQIWAQKGEIKMERSGGKVKEGFRGGLQKWQFDT